MQICDSIVSISTQGRKYLTIYFLNHKLFGYELGQLINIVIDTHFYKNLAGIYLLKADNGNTKTRCKICSKLIIKTPEQRYC